MIERIGHITLYRAQGYAHLLGDLLVRQPFTLGEQKCPSDLGLEPVEHQRDAFEQLQE
ncbi:hypothetical protein D3C78_1911400 [compost metagenome]